MKTTQEKVSITALNEAWRARMAEALSGLKGIPLRTLRESDGARITFGKITYTGDGGTARLSRTFELLGVYPAGSNDDLETLVRVVAQKYPTPEKLSGQKGIGPQTVRAMKKLYLAYGLIPPQEIRDGDAIQEWAAKWARTD